jgi:TusA-related sulfurtransferase
MVNKGTEKYIDYDIRGQICPSCLLMTLNEVNQNQDELKSGQVMLRVKTDNRHATSTIPGAVENMGYSVAVNKLDSHYEIIVAGKNMSHFSG